MKIQFLISYLDKLKVPENYFLASILKWVMLNTTDDF
jgi:hypothetical protein